MLCTQVAISRPEVIPSFDSFASQVWEDEQLHPDFKDWGKREQRYRRVAETGNITETGYITRTFTCFILLGSALRSSSHFFPNIDCTYCTHHKPCTKVSQRDFNRFRMPVDAPSPGHSSHWQCTENYLPDSIYLHLVLILVDIF